MRLSHRYHRPRLTGTHHGGWEPRQSVTDGRGHETLNRRRSGIALDVRVATSGPGDQRCGRHLRRSGEFNWWTGAHSAHAVMRRGAPVRLVVLDVALQVRLTRDHAAAAATGGDRSASSLASARPRGWDRLARANPGDPEAARSCAMHDPLAVAAVSHSPAADLSRRRRTSTSSRETASGGRGDR